MINSAEEFLRLRCSENPDEYSRAANEDAPLDVWLDLISNHEEMKEWVIQNKTVPIEILEVLSHDNSVAIRTAIADKRKLTLALFEILSRDKDEVVRQRIAYNRKTPTPIIERLLLDSSQLVRDAATTRIKR